MPPTAVSSKIGYLSVYYSTYYTLQCDIYNITVHLQAFCFFAFTPMQKKINKKISKQDRIRFQCIQVVDHYISLHDCTHESYFMNEQSDGPLSPSLPYTLEYFTLFPIVFLYRGSNSTVHKNKLRHIYPSGDDTQPLLYSQIIDLVLIFLRCISYAPII